MSEPTSLKRILILDDDADFRRLLRVYLAKLLPGVEVAEYDPVARGAPGDDFDWSPYDALILDYYLCIHNVTGLDILQAHRKNRFFPATIMMTGAGNEEVAVRALRAGVYDYLRKEKFDKEQLKNSLLAAVEKHRVERAKQMEQTNHSRAFNKALFYQELEQGRGDRDEDRVLMVVEVDDHDLMEERFGIIIRDNIVRHLARQCYEFFKLAKANPHITRLNDQSVALLVNDPGPLTSLADTMDSLCAYLHDNPYRFEDRKLRFTVSIGVVPVPRTRRKAETLLAAARECVGMAAVQEGNSFHIFTARAAPRVDDEIIPEPVPSPAPAPAEEAGWRPAPVAQPAPAVETEPPRTPAPESPRSPPRPAAPAPGPVPRPASAAPRTGPQPPPRPAAPGPARPPFRQTARPAAPAAPAPVAPATIPPVPAPESKATPASPARTAAAAVAAGAEIELDESLLDAAALNLKRAFSENRVTQLFRPLVSLTTEGQDAEREVYRVNLQLVDTGGRIEEEDRIHTAASLPEFRKYIDRWLLRETIGRVVNNPPDKYLFLLPLSEASLADPGLFNWLRKLLAGLDRQQPGKSIALELAAANFVALEKPASALMGYLHKSHGFRFVLGQVHTMWDVRAVAGGGPRFDMVLMHSALLRELGEEAAGAGQEALLAKLRHHGQRIVVDDIEDATSLTDAIAMGADYAMGRFVGEPVAQLNEITNVESVELV